MSFPGGPDGNKSFCNECRRPQLDPWIGKIPWRRAWHPFQYSCLENPHSQRSLAGYIPWDHKESDRIVPLSIPQHKLSSVLSSPLFLGSQLPKEPGR